MTSGSESVTLWDALPRAWRIDDPSDVVSALVRVADAHLQGQYDDITTAFDAWDPLTCEARWLPEIARAQGWTLDTTLPVALQRKIVASLMPLYAEKGTIAGLADAVRLFVGEEARIRPLWAGGWRLGRSRLGGFSVRYTAVGGETSIDCGALSALWKATPHTGALRVWRNNVELEPYQYLATSPTEVAIYTSGVRLNALGIETYLDLPFAYYGGHNAVVVERNGMRIDPPAWAELTGGSGYYTRINFPTPPTLGDVITVWHLESRGELTVGDVFRLQTTETRTARLAPALPSTRGFTIIVEMPRALSTDERRALVAVLDVMKPSVMRILLDDAEDIRPRWRLGVSRLGRETRLGP